MYIAKLKVTLKQHWAIIVILLGSVLIVKNLILSTSNTCKTSLKLIYNMFYIDFEMVTDADAGALGAEFSFSGFLFLPLGHPPLLFCCVVKISLKKIQI